MCDVVEGVHVITLSLESYSTVETSHCVVNASQIMKTINMSVVSEMKEPLDEMVFHVVWASG